MEFNYDILSKEWDAIAEERYRDLKDGHDISYSKILKPALLKALRPINLDNVLEVGCGVGVFTEELAQFSIRVTAVDIGEKSIEIARRNSSSNNITYLHANVNDLKLTIPFTAVVSNMTLMNVPDVTTVINSIKKLMAEGSTFIFTITHPAFWPLYWEYTSGSFNYNIETDVLTKFRTRFRDYNVSTHHFHRPLSEYVNVLADQNFRITQMQELKGEQEKQWYPRFLLIQADLRR